MPTSGEEIERVLKSLKQERDEADANAVRWTTERDALKKDLKKLTKEHEILKCEYAKLEVCVQKGENPDAV